MSSAPRLTVLHLDALTEGTARRERWARATVGMTLWELRALGIRRREARYLVWRGVALFDPPLDPLPAPARRSRAPRPAPVHGKPRAETTPRPCLRCRRTFPSEGAHHRLCHVCKGVAADMSPLALD